MIYPAFQFDQISERAAAVNKRAAGTRKSYMRVRGVTKSTAARDFRGESGPTLHFLMQLSVAPRASAYPIIAEGIATVNQAQIKDARTDELLARLHELNEIEHEADADEDRQTLRVAVLASREQRNAAATADVRVAELCLERAAIQRELAIRGV